jgi:hypothetical protein
LSAGFASICCILVQPPAEGENAKPQSNSTLHVAAFWCSVVARILSPARLPVSPLRHVDQEQLLPHSIRLAEIR